MNIKKIAVSLIAAGTFLGIAVAPAFGTNVNQGNDEDQSTHLKATICHWAHGNLSEPSVSLDAVKTAQDTGHGLLTLGDDETFVSFVPHTETGGHEQDAIIDVYWKKGNDITFTYQAHTLCNPEVTTTTTTVPEVTTTTVPEVTTTTVPEVTTTTQAPPVVVTPPATDTPAPTAAPVPTVPVASPTGQLPHTGSAAQVLASIGALVGLTGLALLLVSAFMKRFQA